MPITEMKKDLYFVTGADGKVWITAERGEAAKKHAENYANGCRGQIYQLTRSTLGVSASAMRRLSDEEMVSLLAEVITGRTPPAAGGGQYTGRTAEVNPTPPLGLVGTAEMKVLAPEEKRKYNGRKESEEEIRKLLMLKSMTLVGKVKHYGYIYREVNVMIMQTLAVSKAPMRRREIHAEVTGDGKWLGRQKNHNTFIDGHLKYLFKSGVIVQVGKRWVMKKPSAGPAPKADPEEERKAHEGVMAGAH